MANKFIKRYLDDYATVQEIDPKSGKPVTKRVYTGSLYTAAMPDKKWKRFKWLFSAGVVTANALIISGAMITAPSNIITALVVPQAIGLFGILYSLYLIGLLLLARYPYTSYYHYRCTSSFPHILLFNVFCFGICTIEALVCAINFRQVYLAAELGTALLMGAGSAGYGYLYHTLKKLHWETDDDKEA